MFRTDHADLNLSTSWLTLAGVIISQPAKHVSVLHDKVQILFAGKLSLRKKIAYKLMESVFCVVKVIHVRPLHFQNLDHDQCHLPLTNEPV